MKTSTLLTQILNLQLSDRVCYISAFLKYFFCFECRSPQSPKKLLNFLKLAFQTIMMNLIWVLGTEPKSSTKAVLAV